MSAHTCPATGSLAATRSPANFIGASSSLSHTGSTQRDMMRQHDAHNEKWGQGAAAKRLPDPAPETPGS